MFGAMWIPVDRQMTRRATRPTLLALSFCGPWYPSCRSTCQTQKWVKGEGQQTRNVPTTLGRSPHQALEGLGGPSISDDERALKWPWRPHNPTYAKPEEPKDSSKKVSADYESMKDTVLSTGQKVHFSEALLLLLERRIPRRGEPFFAWPLAKKRRVVSDYRWKMRRYLGAFRWTGSPFRAQERVTDMSGRHWCSALVGSELMHIRSQETARHRWMQAKLLYRNICISYYYIFVFLWFICLFWYFIYAPYLFVCQFIDASMVSMVPFYISFLFLCILFVRRPCSGGAVPGEWDRGSRVSVWHPGFQKHRSPIKAYIKQLVKNQQTSGPSTNHHAVTCKNAQENEQATPIFGFHCLLSCPGGKTNQ